MLDLLFSLLDPHEVERMRIFHCNEHDFKLALVDFIRRKDRLVTEFTKFIAVEKNYDSSALLVKSMENVYQLLTSKKDFPYALAKHKSFVNTFAIRLAILQLLSDFDAFIDEDNTLNAHIKQYKPFQPLCPNRSLKYGGCDLAERVKGFRKLLDEGQRSPLQLLRRTIIDKAEEDRSDEDNWF